MTEFTLKIDGMHCSSCVRRVSQTLAGIPGLAVKEVSVGIVKLATAQEPAPGDDTIGLAIAALAKAGYTAYLES